MTTWTGALDVGGTKIAYGLVDPDQPTDIVATGEIPSQPRQSTPQRQVRAALWLLTEAAAARGGEIGRIGIGAPGVIKGPNGLVTYAGATMPTWQGTDLSALAATVTPAPVACHNDVRILAYGELAHGAGSDLGPEDTALFFSLGTGVGGAVVSRGALQSGPTGSAGEFSELVCADYLGRAQRCENVASGTGLALCYNDALAAGDRQPRQGWREPLAADVDTHEVLRRALAGEELARRVVDGNLRGFGEAIGALVTAFDASVVILGGGLAHAGPVVTRPIAAGVREASLAPNRRVPVRVASLGTAAPLIGAAAYALAHYP